MMEKYMKKQSLAQSSEMALVQMRTLVTMLQMTLMTTAEDDSQMKSMLAKTISECTKSIKVFDKLLDEYTQISIENDDLKMIQAALNAQIKLRECREEVENEGQFTLTSDSLSELLSQFIVEY